MAKELRVSVADFVAFNELDDATWFEVLEIDGFTLTIREAGTEFATQQMDRCFVKQVRQDDPTAAPALVR